MAVVTETITDNGRQFLRTYSDAGKMIIQDETGFEYEEAIDPAQWPRTYTESENDIPSDEDEEQEDEADYITAARILLGEE